MTENRPEDIFKRFEHEKLHMTNDAVLTNRTTRAARLSFFLLSKQQFNKPS